MFKRIHHVAIAVHGLDAGAAIWGSAGLGLTEEGREDVGGQATRVAMFPVGASRIELLEPLGDGPVQRHLENRGPGIHHLCFEVDDLEAEMARLRAAGMQFTTELPSLGAHGARVAFLHPRHTGGVLIELNELPEPHP